MSTYDFDSASAVMYKYTIHSQDGLSESLHLDHLYLLLILVFLSISTTISTTCIYTRYIFFSTLICNFSEWTLCNNVWRPKFLKKFRIFENNFRI